MSEFKKARLEQHEISFEGKTADEIKLISDYLKYAEYLAKWNGELPSVMGESDILLSMDELKKKAE